MKWMSRNEASVSVCKYLNTLHIESTKKMKTPNSPLTFFPSLSLLDPSSSAWNLRFSSKKISPSLLFLTASSVSLPTQSGRKVTGLERSSESLSACDQEARWLQGVYMVFEERLKKKKRVCVVSVNQTEGNSKDE